MVNLVPVQSSCIQAVGYDESIKEMYIQFKGGTVAYTYHRVPKDIYDEFLLSSSKGHYYHLFIRGKFD